MEKKLHIIHDSFQPNSAPTNRFLAFARGYGELGIKVNVVFAFPDQNFEKVNERFENVNFIYIWDKFKTKNKYLTYFTTRLYLILFFLKLSRNDIVILYGMNHFLWLVRFKKSIKLYHERTESPDVVGREYGIMGNFMHKRYLNACKKLDGLFVISPSLNEYFIVNAGVKQEKVHTINMIVDLSRFEDINCQNKNNTIAYCGTISQNKDGISYLLKSFAIISKKYHDITLTLIGHYESVKTEHDILQLIKDLAINERVNIMGTISSSKMPILLSEAKILALARPNNKQAKYGFPTKLGEYLMTGNPVVITQVGDIDKYLKDMENVIFSKPDDVNDFAEKLLWTLDNYQKAREIGLRGRKLATESFNYKTESQKVLKVVFNE